MRSITPIICLVTVLAWRCSLGKPTCPPEDFDAVDGLDLVKFTSAPWYSQQQMPQSFQPKSQLFCVRARYQLVDDSDLSKGINMLYYANQDEVNGRPVLTGRNGTHVELTGLVPNVDEPAKLIVAPSFFAKSVLNTLQQFFIGDHWVVAVGPSDDPKLGYSWAIISAGPPRTQGKNGCLTKIRFLGLFEVHEGGLWLLSRKPVDPESTAFMRNVARALGFDVDVVEDVPQQGCLYKGAP